VGLSSIPAFAHIRLRVYISFLHEAKKILLDNDSVNIFPRNNMTSIARQRTSKHASLIIEAVLSVWSVPMDYKRTQRRTKQSRAELRVEFREASLPGYELGSRGIELSRVFGTGCCRIMARKELDCANKTSCVI
jgi:hypothetical protein